MSHGFRAGLEIALAGKAVIFTVIWFILYIHQADTSADVSDFFEVA